MNLTVAGEAFFKVALTPELAKKHIASHRRALKSLVKKGCRPSYFSDLAAWQRKVAHHLDGLYVLVGRIEKELPETPTNVGIHGDAVQVFNYFKEYFTRTAFSLGETP